MNEYTHDLPPFDTDPENAEWRQGMEAEAEYEDDSAYAIKVALAIIIMAVLTLIVRGLYGW